MTKVVLTTKISPTYDDLPEERYHFPRTYLNQVQSAIHDWVVYYEPRRQDAEPGGRKGRQSYFASARIARIDPDPNRSDHYYAIVSDFLEFDRPVPFRETRGYYEAALVKLDGSTNKGAFGRAVRPIPDHEFETICQAGFSKILVESVSNVSEAALPGFADEQADFARPIVQQLISRPFRDANFTTRVRDAYDCTCAVTGLKILNGGGRPEIEAAHIRPVGDGHNGPDSVRNGIALCRTVHWMFDRALISFTSEFELMVSRQGVPDNVKGLFLPNLKNRLPADRTAQPHAQYLEYHREEIFKKHTRDFEIVG